jgi:hypothetical protein
VHASGPHCLEELHVQHSAECSAVTIVFIIPANETLYNKQAYAQALHARPHMQVCRALAQPGSSSTVLLQLSSRAQAPPSLVERWLHLVLFCCNCLPLDLQADIRSSNLIVDATRGQQDLAGLLIFDRAVGCSECHARFPSETSC